MSTKSNTEIINYMEIFVEELIDDILKKVSNCTCELCRLDAKALALNNLKPMYVVTKKGDYYTKKAALKAQFEVDVTAAVVRSVELVSKNPRHY